MHVCLFECVLCVRAGVDCARAVRHAVTGELWCVCDPVQRQRGGTSREWAGVSCSCGTFACKTQVFSSDPRAVLMMQRFGAGGGDLGQIQVCGHSWSWNLAS